MGGQDVDVHVVSERSDTALDPFRNLKDAASAQRGRFIVESERVLKRSIELGISIESILVTPSRWKRIESVVLQMERTGERVQVIIADPATLDATIGFAMHRGVVALARRPVSLDPLTALASAHRVVVLEDVVDPDNVGSVFQHAAAFGADLVVLSEHAGDPLYRKAVRTSMGWVLDVPWTRLERHHDTAACLHAAGYLTYALTPTGETDIDDEGLRRSESQRVAIVLGSEHDGLPPSTLARATRRVRIPIAAHVDSLNVATAAALAMFSLFRPRG